MRIKNLLEQYQKVIVWGTGNYYYKFKYCLPEQTAYLIDNNPGKWDTMLDGKQIFSPYVLQCEKTEGTLIIICNNYFDEITEQLRDYGMFDVIDIVTIAMVREHEQELNNIPKNAPDSEHSVLICAGIHALWQRNGARKFIEGQIDILQCHGYQTIETAPLMYLKRSGEKETYLVVSCNRSYRGLFSVEEFVKSYSYKSVMIHSLYFQYEILEQLIENRDLYGKTLYYLHDYFILCKNRFLFRGKKLCLDDNNMLHCDKCNLSEEQKIIQSFHSDLFAKCNVTLVSPSIDTKRRVEPFYQGISTEVVPHLIFEKKTFERKRHKKLRIAFLGVALWQKGWNEFCEIVDQNYSYYDFFCIGDCEEKKRKEHIKYLPVEINSKEHLTMLQMLQKCEIDIAYIGSVLPETYSYTYFEAYEAGCFVITTKRSGNVYKETEKNKNGKVFCSIGEMNIWLSDTEKAQKEVEAMNKKIFHVKNNESFIDLLK